MSRPAASSINTKSQSATPLAYRSDKHIGGADAALQKGTVDEGKEKVRRGNDVVALPRRAHAAVERDRAVGRAEIVAVPQPQISQQGLQLGLGDLAGSALEFRVGRQAPTRRQSHRGRVEIDREGAVGGEGCNGRRKLVQKDSS